MGKRSLLLVLLLFSLSLLLLLPRGELKKMDISASVVGLGAGAGGMEETETETETELESDTSRRLWNLQKRRYISYELLKADEVPCSRPGMLYYNCHSTTARVSPYQRGCGIISRCARFNDP